MTSPSPAAGVQQPRVEPALIVIAAGVCAALHIGKLPPAITTLREALGMTLVQAGFLLSLVQVAGMTCGVAFGALADSIGLRRSMAIGLVVLAVASALGGLSQGVVMLMVLRASEGFGFLLVVLPAPGLIRRLVAPKRVSVMMGLWGAYMPLATALALLIGPLCIGAWGWRAWWWALAVVSLVMAAVLLRCVPATLAAQPPSVAAPWLQRLRRTLVVPGPWLVALTFATYSGQWLAVIGFLPAIYTQAGVSGAATGVLTALAAAANIVGNVSAGRMLHRGVTPARLLVIGFVTMAIASAATFAGAAGEGLPAWARFIAVLLFSGVGGLIPATLFALAVRVAPSEGTLSTTIGWMQQWSALGQFFGPPLVAWVASRTGGWQFTWLATGACSVAGLALAGALARISPSLPAVAPSRR
ncbi:MAG: MFS transporter [Pseudomonadota bacterium]|nr:MFS transporter [Pseudomonadota bacterium]